MKRRRRKKHAIILYLYDDDRLRCFITDISSNCFRNVCEYMCGGHDHDHYDFERWMSMGVGGGRWLLGYETRSGTLISRIFLFAALWTICLCLVWFISHPYTNGKYTLQASWGVTANFMRYPYISFPTPKCTQYIISRIAGSYKHCVRMW